MWNHRVEARENAVARPNDMNLAASNVSDAELRSSFRGSLMLDIDHCTVETDSDRRPFPIELRVSDPRQHDGLHVLLTRRRIGNETIHKQSGNRRATIGKVERITALGESFFRRKLHSFETRPAVSRRLECGHRVH